MTLELLRAEQKQGVDRVIFTPHFDPEKSTVEDFWDKRDRAFVVTREACRRDPELCKLHFKRGAEVYFRPSLVDMECSKLCMTDTPYLLIEFSFTREQLFVDETIYDLRTRGIIPIIAHVERYPYIMKDISKLEHLVEQGCLVQTNCETLARDGSQAKKMMELMQDGLVHLVSTDAHHPEKRPVNMRAGLKVVDKHLGRAWTNELIKNGNLIFAGRKGPQN